MKFSVSLFLCLFLGCSVIGLATGPNLVKDASFETAAINGIDWTPDSYNKGAGSVIQFVDGGVSGKCLYIESRAENHAFALQEIAVEEGKTYKLSAMIKAEGINGGKGASIGIVGKIISTNDFKETSGNYQPVECYIKPEMTNIMLMAQLGGYGSQVTGKAWFDNVSLVEVKPEEIAEGANVEIIDNPKKAPENKGGIDNGWYGLMMFTAGLVVGSLIFIYLPIIKRKIEEYKEAEENQDEDDNEDKQDEENN